MAALDNASASEIDKTSFWWTGLCGICHPGGGPSEYDRDGDLYFDAATGLTGWETRGETAGDQEFDGDYSEVSNATGLETHPAPWDVTGVLEPDCLYCHRVQRTIMNPGPGQYMNMNWIWRAGVLRKKQNLVDAAAGLPVPAFAAAPTAGQGWGTVVLGSPPPGKPPIANTFDIDYGMGVTDGSLVADAANNLKIAATAVQGAPNDWSCWGCHAIADDKKRGRVWFDPTKDVHYAGFNNLASDGSATQAELDAARMASNVCASCHGHTGTPEFPGDGTNLNPGEHNFAKGNANLGTARDDTDYYGFRTCADCHMAGPDKDPDAPLPANAIHTTGTHLEKMSCQFCHIAFKHDPASLSIDNATTGSTINYNTDAFLSADPLNPGSADKTAWYPSATWRNDKDGLSKIFPAKLLLSTWWGDWDDADADYEPDAGEALGALFLWKVRAVVSGASLTSTDDNGDGKAEVNTIPEIQAYLTAIQGGSDVHTNPLVQGRAVLVKGGLVYYLDAAGAVGIFPIHNSGMHVESEHPFSVDHNVLPLAQANTLGAGGDCDACHAQPSPVFDRLILVDPFDPVPESGVGVGDGAGPMYHPLRDILNKPADYPKYFGN